MADLVVKSSISPHTDNHSSTSTSNNMTSNSTTPTSLETPNLEVHLHSDYGRYITASKSFPRKAVILSEVPVMAAPWPIDDKVTFDEPLCLGCCKYMKRLKRSPLDHDLSDDLDSEDLEIIQNLKVETDEEYFARLLRKVPKCSKCGWPVCSKVCENLPIHRENECLIFEKIRMPYPPAGENMNIVTTSVMIQLIRLLMLKGRDKGKFEKVKQLQCQTALGTYPWNFGMLLDDIKLILPEVERDLGSREECCRILSIININAFSNTFNHNGEFSGCSICLFLDGSMIAHSCSPNCWWTLTEDPSHSILIKSSMPISAGDMITVCYSNQYSIFGTSKREEMFRSIGGFTCKCRRCLDPSELGSFTSGVLCEHCMTGYKLPVKPTEALSPWKCDLCQHTENSEIILTIVKALENRLYEIVGPEQGPPRSFEGEGGGVRVVQSLSRFLENSKSLVHNNHWIVTQTEDQIMKEWARDPDVRFGGSTPEDIMISCEYFISLCYHQLAVRNLVSPGLSFHRARYLLFFARTRMARLEFMVALMDNPQRYNLKPEVIQTSSILSIRSINDNDKDNDKVNNDRDNYFKMIREEFQEILQLYHEVMEYRQMSQVKDEEIKGEIEHLIKIIKPIIQMEPHQKRILNEIVGETDEINNDNDNNDESQLKLTAKSDDDVDNKVTNNTEDNDCEGGCSLS